MHLVALMVLFDADGLLLLQHRTDDAPFFPGYWGLFGGALEAEETPLQAVTRESWEELCYRPQQPSFILEQDFQVGELACRKYLYAELYTGDRADLQLREGQGWGWFNEAQISQLLMTDHDRTALAALRDQMLRTNP